MSHRLLIVTGHDRPGIVGVVSGLLARHQINLEDLRMSILEGQFAMMVVVRIPEKKTQTELDRELKTLEKKWELTTFQCGLGSLRAAALNKKSTPTGSTLIIRVLGKDKTGIVAEISRVLAKHKCNILDLQCRILGAGARAIYTMVLECRVPPATKVPVLKSALKRSGQTLGVEIQIQSADVIQL